ncbi:MAG: hypothetical protein ABRQ38_22565 [Candidatus Eremiobacterota bacterium]
MSLNSSLTTFIFDIDIREKVYAVRVLSSIAEIPCQTEKVQL